MPDFTSFDAQRMFLERANFDPNKVFEIEDRINEIAHSILEQMVDDDNEEMFHTSIEMELEMAKTLGHVLKKYPNHGLAPVAMMAMLAVRLCGGVHIAAMKMPDDGVEETVMTSVNDIGEAPPDAEHLSFMEVAALYCSLVISLTRVKVQEQLDDEEENDTDDG